VEPYQEPALTEDGSDYKYGIYDRYKKDDSKLDTERVFDPKPQILNASKAKQEQMKNEPRFNTDLAALSLWMSK
jgi:hypothetical protein